MNPQEYMKQLGRDGSYAECDVKESLSLIKEGQPFPKMLILKSNRLEVSDPDIIAALERVMKNFKQDPESTPEQNAFALFLKIFESGVKVVDAEV